MSAGKCSYNIVFCTQSIQHIFCNAHKYTLYHIDITDNVIILKQMGNLKCTYIYMPHLVLFQLYMIKKNCQSNGSISTIFSGITFGAHGGQITVDTV